MSEGIPLSLTYKIDGPEVLGKIELSTRLCKQHNKKCRAERACDILGQCMLEHPKVKQSQKFTKELRKVNNLKETLSVFESKIGYLIKYKPIKK